MSELLAVDDLRTGYGSLPVLHGVSIRVEEGEIAVLLGANGVGKTTTLDAISGLRAPWSGSVRLDGVEITRVPAEKIVARGLGMVPAPPGVFRELSVLDNLRAGAFASRGNATRLDEVFETFPILAERRAQAAGSLSGGEQRMLAIARALVGRPRMLLLDEVSMGLSPAMVNNVLRLLRDVRRAGVTVLMAEQNVGALEIADRAFVMERGRIVREDRGADLDRTREEAVRAYLGGVA